MNYETLIITFAEPIRMLDDFFDDPETWGVETLKEWVDNYESIEVDNLAEAIRQCRECMNSPCKMPSGHTVGENHAYMLKQLLAIQEQQQRPPR